MRTGQFYEFQDINRGGDGDNLQSWEGVQCENYCPCEILLNTLMRAGAEEGRVSSLP